MSFVKALSDLSYAGQLCIRGTLALHFQCIISTLTTIPERVWEGFLQTFRNDWGLISKTFGNLC